MEKVRESYNHHLAAAREKDITAFCLRDAVSAVIFFIEHATSAGHHKNMYTHRNEKKDIKHSGKKHTHIKTL